MTAIWIILAAALFLAIFRQRAYDKEQAVERSLNSLKETTIKYEESSKINTTEPVKLQPEEVVENI